MTMPIGPSFGPGPQFSLNATVLDERAYDISVRQWMPRSSGRPLKFRGSPGHHRSRCDCALAKTSAAPGSATLMGACPGPIISPRVAASYFMIRMAWRRIPAIRWCAHWRTRIPAQQAFLASQTTTPSRTIPTNITVQRSRQRADFSDSAFPMPVCSFPQHDRPGNRFCRSCFIATIDHSLFPRSPAASCK